MNDYVDVNFNNIDNYISQINFTRNKKKYFQMCNIKII